MDSDRRLDRIASVNRVGPDGWCLYADGYRCAGNLLIDNVGTTYERNTIIFPILSMYHHWIELTLKDIIVMGQYLRREPSNVPFHHKIKDLWSEAKGIVRRFVRTVSEPDLDDVTTLIEEIAGLNPEGVPARFPMTKDGRAAFPFDAPDIDLDDLREKMDHLALLLKRPLSLLAMEVDFEAEYRQDTYGE